MTELPPENVAETTAVEHDRAPDQEILRDELDELASELISAGTAVQTGHPSVDEVLGSLDVLNSRSVDEHVAVFEQAHEQLRRTLSGAGDD